MQNHDTALSGDTTAVKETSSLARRIWSALMGEERPLDMWVLLLLLVLLLHVWLLTVLMKPEETMVQAEPLVMEVSMIAISAPKPAAEPPKPAAAPPPPPPREKKQPPPKKPKKKPVVKKAAPVVRQEVPDFAPFEPMTTPPQDTQSTNTAPASSSGKATEANSAPAFTEANFRANYAHNPKPHYPAIARSRSWQGKVLLRVKVSAQGLSDDVTVEQSSGHEILDESAIEAVKKWRFIPAKRGDTPVASSVIVPIDFKLRN